tara:strand:- start:870 stop:1289 length:420 start_codon:yes stop_codon:yes gene_type:complete
MKKYLFIILLVGVCFGQANFLDLVDEPNYEYSGFSKIKLININVFGFESIRGFSNERIKRIVENLCYQILPDGLIYDENKYRQYINEMKIEYNDTDYLIDLVGRKYGFKIIVDLRAIEHKNSSGKYYGSINVASVLMQK